MQKATKKATRALAQEAVKAPTVKAAPVKAPAVSKAGISAPKFAILTVPLVNAPGSPLVVHAFSAKARGIMREAQELGSLGKKRKPKDPKDFDAAYHGARHISREGSLVVKSQSP